MPNSKQIVYLSQSQYAELIANGTITVDGVTVTYDENDIYVTPQAEPVTDVRIAGTSVAANGVANIPVASSGALGVVRVQPGYGIKIQSDNNSLRINEASDATIKQGTDPDYPIVSKNASTAAFYGLAKVAGHDEASSTEPLGTYTPEAKGAIQSMLGVSDLIATMENSLVASKAYEVGDVFTANGKLYKVTSAIAANDSIVLQNEGETVSGANAVETKVGEGFVKFTDYATGSTAGVVKVNDDGTYGIRMLNGQLAIKTPASTAIKNGNSGNQPITPLNQNEAVFYGLAKAAGDTTQAASDNEVGTYTSEAKAAIKTMLGIPTMTDIITAVHNSYPAAEGVGF